jgi:hypothetical protein
MADAATLQRTLDNLVHRIVRPVHPRRIIVFGSAARGGMGPTVPEMRPVPGSPQEWYGCGAQADAGARA